VKPTSALNRLQQDQEEHLEGKSLERVGAQLQENGYWGPTTSVTQTFE